MALSLYSRIEDLENHAGIAHDLLMRAITSGSPEFTFCALEANKSLGALLFREAAHLPKEIARRYSMQYETGNAAAAMLQERGVNGREGARIYLHRDPKEGFRMILNGASSREIVSLFRYMGRSDNYRGILTVLDQVRDQARQAI